LALNNNFQGVGALYIIKNILDFSLFLFKIISTIINMVVHFLSQGQEIQKDNSDKNITFFNKNELSSILSFYGKKVSQGLLKDYAIDHLKTHAIFSFYRNTFESAYLQIYKNKKNTKARSKYSLINSAGVLLKHNENLESLLTYIDKSGLSIVK
jgi:hypothetical protein